MTLTRRELIAASAGAGAYLGLSFPGSALASDLNSQPISRLIPRTGESLPVIGLGTNAWLSGDDAKATAALAATLETFHLLGGRVIDTAPAYRSSEAALGQLITQMDFRDAFFLATKVDRSDKEEGLLRMEDSLTKLRTNSVDLMQVHNLRGAAEQIETLLEWKQAGRIRYIGATTSRVSQFAEMEQLMQSMPLDFVQLNYSLADRDAEKRLLPMARERGIAVMINRPFAHNRLFEAAAGQKLPAWATEFECKSWAQFFLKYVVANPGVTCAIPGTTSEIHVRDNMGAGFGLLPDEALRKRQEDWFESV